MIKKISIQQLKPGMFIHDINCAWMEHPFLVGMLKIKDGKIIKKIADLGVRELYAAGFFWGGILGGVYSTLGVTLGGWISFLTARWLIGQPLADQFENKWVNKVQQEFDRNGWKFVAFARINPIIPTGPLNYLLGLTSLSNRGFLWATFVFLLPPSIAVAYIGDTLQTFTANQADVSEIIRGILIISAAVTFLALVKFISNIYKRRSEK